MLRLFHRTRKSEASRFKASLLFSATGWITLVLAALLGCMRVSAQQGSGVRYIVEPGSKLWIEGSSTIGDYTCNTSSVDGHADLVTGYADTKGAVRADSILAMISVAVNRLECGNRQMNSDLYKAMKSDQYESIEYNLLEASVVPGSSGKSGFMILKTKGILTIAGRTNSVEIDVSAIPMERGRVHIFGSKKLSMADYEIIPPSAFWGLIKADEKLVVSFSIIASVQENTADRYKKNEGKSTSGQ